MSQPEIWGVGSWTPLGGFLGAAQRYWSGLQASDGSTIWPSASAGFDPIRNDPTKLSFLPNGCDPSPTCTTNCCVEQCRPYITVMLTDGDETCGGNAETVAASMLATTIDARRYRIETRVIGFGVTPGDDDIEAYAHAGGAIDIPGVYEGFYANNEADLQLALSQILTDAIRSESCNNLDDDCDTKVDEEFLPPALVPGKGGMCTNGQLGVCVRTGTLVCRADGAGVECNAPLVTGTSEICNVMDDDCDGRVDEGLDCHPCVPVGEICNNADDDCDGVADKICRCSNDITARCDGVGNDCGTGTCVCTDLTKQCGTGSCVGIETCESGIFTGCTAQTPTTEICNGRDDDCDGLCDGFTRECSEVNMPCDPAVQGSCPGTDSPGHPNNNPIAQNICRPGIKTCPLSAACSGSNSFGACSGEVKPCNGVTPCDPMAPPSDPCNGLDDDCDNFVDERFVPADCSTNCGVGQTVCLNGQIMCNSTPATSDPTCNNVDDDCDGMFDEDWQCPDVNPQDGMCDPCGEGLVCMGVEKCINGQVVCDGGPIGTEVCNCLDDNCNNLVDEGTICPNGSACVACQCAFMCAPGEFPCPLGKKCDNGYCVNDPCYGVACPPVNGNAQTCIPKPGFPNEPQCVDTCSITSCSSPLICYTPTGECRPDDCTTFPDRCSANQACINGMCVTNPCKDVMCSADQYCLGGSCVPSCADVSCPMGQRCRQGVCENDPCGKPCPFGHACNEITGKCIEDPCEARMCPQGQWCNPGHGQCEDDACVQSMITCPHPGERCLGGTCFDPDTLEPDAANEAHVTVGGGGGCSTTGPGGEPVVLVLLALLGLRRRRRGTGGAR
jgi:Notch 1